jgi:hypothetical protein
MGAAAVACTLEFVADKVPWVDSLWDSFHTVIRPIGALLIGTQILGAQNPAVQMGLALLCGGVALAGHSSKAATRLVINHSPEPFTNIAMSVAEDAAVPFGLWLTLKHPLVTCVVVAVFLAIFAWLAPKLFRVLHVEWLAFKRVVARHFGEWSAWQPAAAAGRLSPEVEQRLSPLPSRYAEAIRARGIGDADEGVFCSAARNVPGLKNSIGYLCFHPGGAAFVGKRLFRYRVFVLPSYSQAEITAGLLFDTFVFETSNGTIEFDAFKVRKRLAPSERPALSHP